MIFDWTPHRYRGGSGWFQAGLVIVSVGLSLPAAVITPAESSAVVQMRPDVTTIAMAQDVTTIAMRPDSTSIQGQTP